MSDLPGDPTVHGMPDVPAAQSSPCDAQLVVCYSKCLDLVYKGAGPDFAWTWSHGHNVMRCLVSHIWCPDCSEARDLVSWNIL